MNQLKIDKRLLMPVLAAYFIIGLCDIVAPVTSRIICEFPAEQHGAISFLPTMVFLWFLILATPFATLMSRIGRKRTVLVGYAFTIAGLMIPYMAGQGSDLIWYFVGFALLGVGNTAVQVASNPMMAAVVPSDRLTSYLTIGQVARNSSILFLALAITYLVLLTGSWRLLLPLFAAITFIAGVWLLFVKLDESQLDKAATLGECFALLRNSKVLISALAIGIVVAADVGLGFVTVRMIDSPSSILATAGYYGCRIIGTLVGAYVLMRYSEIKYLRWNLLAAMVLTILLFFLQSPAAIYVAVGCMGLVMSCVFSSFYAVAAKAEPDKQNQISGLMVMSISIATIGGPICGLLIRVSGHAHFGIAFVVACVSYLLWASFKLKIN